MCSCQRVALQKRGDDVNPKIEDTKTALNTFRVVELVTLLFTRDTHNYDDIVPEQGCLSGFTQEQ